MIYLVTATIRPEQFLETEAFWRKQSSKKNEITTKVIVDTESDKKIINNPEICDVYGLKAGGITKPLTKLTKKLVSYIDDEDIIVVMSDDFYPPKNWDKYLINFYKKHKGCLSVKIKGLNDGNRNTIISLPIMDGYTLKRLNGYIYHPAYNHQFSDNELFDNVKYLNLLHIENDESAPFFEHKHWTTSDRQRDEYDNINNKTAVRDRDIYNNRKNMLFETRIKESPVLSILICSLIERKKSLDHLLSILNPQVDNKSVEIKICKDNGELTLSRKRNVLLNNSLGEYICFIDDDDVVSSDYIEEILDSLVVRPDCVGFRGSYYVNGRYSKDFIISMEYDKWGETSKYFERTINHLCPIKRDIIFGICGFDENIRGAGEDADYSKRIIKNIKTQKYIDKSLYAYRFETKNKKY
jgi:hypothetical protein